MNDDPRFLVSADEASVSIEGRGDLPASPLIDAAIERGWKTIEGRGDFSLRRALWFEGEMRGVAVKNFTPSPADHSLVRKMKEDLKRLPPSGRMTAQALQADYRTRVLPQLQKEWQKAQEDLVRSQKSGSPSSVRPAKERFELLDRKLEAVGNYLSDLSRRQGETIEVRPVFEDGVMRITEKKTRTRERTAKQAIGR
jgi:hypothetical protein